ncbi:MAG: choice-of-anchor D domain-containing protein [Verrucomicrobiae bacterium]|nr:choice-of-anchor D domain-containing protein [Verrucomicrobiae bacterium]
MAGDLHGQVPASLNVDKLVSDPARPLVYGLHQDGANTGTLIVYNRTSQTVTEGIPVGTFPTDLAITNDGSALFVLNTGDPSIMKIDLDSRQIVKTLNLTTFGTWGSDITVTPGDIAIGPGNVIFYIDGTWGPILHSIDFETEQLIESRQLSNQSTTGGWGDLVISHDKTRLYGWHQYGWSAGSLGTWVSAFSIAASGELTQLASGPSQYLTNFQRDPRDSPALLSEDGQTLIVKDRMVDRDNPGQFPVTFPETIYGLSPNGSLASGSSSLFKAATGELLAEPDPLSKVQCYTRDGTELIFFNGTTSQIEGVDLVDLLGQEETGLITLPADGKIGPQPSQLEWYARDGAASYRVYLGMDRTAVENAAPGSALQVGETSNPSFAITETLATGTYYWRVEAVTSDGIFPGEVNSFSVFPIELESRVLDAGPLVGVGNLTIEIPLESTTISGTSWVTSENLPWLTLTPGGQVPDVLEVQISTDGLAAGSYSGTFTLTVGSDILTFDINFSVDEPHIVYLEADLELPFIYGISQPQPESGKAYLLKIDAETGEIIQSVDAGEAVTDIDIHYGEGRIYLTNWLPGVVRVFDRETFESLKPLNFPAVGTYTNGYDAYRIAAAGPGRLLVEGEDQWVRAQLLQTSDGEQLATISPREGGGEFGPMGRYYYHGDNGTSGAELHLYDTEGDTFTHLNSVRTTGVSYYGSREVVVSPTGNRVYWNGSAHDADLEVLWTIDQEIHASTLRGDLVFTPGAARNGTTGEILASLPEATTVMAVSGDQTKLFLAKDGVLSSVEIDSIASVPENELAPLSGVGGFVLTTNPVLKWTKSPFAHTYRVYFGASQAAVDAADENSAEFLGEVTSNELALIESLDLGGAYFWRVDSIGYSAVVKGGVWSLEVAPIEVSPIELEIEVPEGVTMKKSVHLNSDGSTSWAASIPQDGPLGLAADSGTTPADLEVIIDTTNLAVGRHESEVVFDAAGKTFSLPVHLNVRPLNFTHIEADLGLPYLYGISQVAENSLEPAFLIKIDEVSGQLLEAFPVGESVSDLEIHYQEDRIYVTNWMTGNLRALDRNTLQEVRVYPVSPFGGVGYSNGDVYRVSAGAEGRIVVEEADQWIDVSLMDTATAVKIAKTGERAGGGEFGPLGRYYYHGDSNISNASLHRFDTQGDTFTEQSSVRTTGVSYYGSRTVIVSPTGGRIYWNGTAHDASLNVLWTINEEVRACSLHGDLVFTPGEARSGVTGEILAPLPVETPVMAVSGDQKTLYLGNGGTLERVDLSSIVELPGNDIEPLIEDGSLILSGDPVLKWTPSPFGASYQVYLGTSLSAVASANPSSAEYQGEVSGSEMSLWNSLAQGTEYFWRVDVVNAGGEVSGGPVWSFEVAPLEVNPTTLSIVIPEGISVSKSLSLSADGAVSWTASVPVDGPLSLSSGSGSTPEELTVTVDASGMEVGSYQFEVTFDAAGKTFAVPVGVEVLALNYTHLEADLELPYVYGISQVSESSTQPAYLVRIDESSGEVVDAIPVGNSVSDIEIHYQDNRIYVTNWMSGKLRAYNRDSLMEGRVHDFTPFGGTGTGGDAYRISAGRAGRIVVEEKDQWIDLNLVSTASGGVVATTFEREGGGEFGPLGRYYYHGDNNISNASLHRFDTQGDTFNELAAVRTTGVSGYGSRTVIVSPSGNRVYWNGTTHDADLNVLWTINEEVFCATLHGDLAFTRGEARNGTTGEVMATLPIDTPIMAVSGDQKKLFLASGGTLTSVDLSTIADLPDNEIEPLIDDGSITIGRDPLLKWTLSPFAVGYRVYFGTSQSAVAEADENSPEYLGEVTVAELALLDSLNLGGTYYWRVDAVGFSSVETGPVWSFEVAPLEANPTALAFVMPEGISVSKSLSLSADGAVSWTASVPVDGPLSLSSSSGSTPEELTVTADASGLEVGSHEYEVTFDAVGKTFAVPVQVEVLALNFTHLEADLALPYVYGISQVSESSTQPAYLVRIDESSGEVVDAIPVGNSVSDIEVHYQENRIYLTNWMSGKLRAFDRGTLAEVQVYDFTPFGGTSTDGDAYRISAGGAGRILVEEKDQWIDLDLIDTATGAVLGTTGEREGGGEFGPQGRYYYHGDNNSSGAELHRFDTQGDNFTELAAVRTTGVSGYGSRTVIVSPSGNRVYWNGTAHDSTLQVLWTINQEIYATTLLGDLVFTSGKARSGVTGDVVADLPIDTSVMAVGGDQKKLFLALGSTLTSVDLTTIMDLPGNEIEPLIEDGSITIGRDPLLQWTPSPFATGYRVYFGTSQSAVAGADENSPEYLGEVTASELALLESLNLGGTYYWRVDRVAFNGGETGPVWSFEVAPLEVNPPALEFALPAEVRVSRNLSLSADGAVSWTASAPVDGPLSLSSNGGGTPEELTVTVDASGLEVGSHEFEVTFDAAGKTFAVPVIVDVLALNFTHLKADPSLPVAWAITQESESSTKPAYLLKLDVTSGSILSATRVGASVSDLAIHELEDRIYVTNWMLGKILAIDRTTLQEVQSYDFVPFGGAGVGGDAYRISAGSLGRLIVEEEDQWIDIHVMDTASGQLLSSAFEREGGGAASPDGVAYYHGDNNISNASLHAFSLTNDVFVENGSVRTTGISYYGDRTVIVSKSGNRIFWNGSAHDPDLNALWSSSRRILASNEGGQLVFTNNAVLRGLNGSQIATLPSASTLVAVSADGEFLLTGSAGQITSTRIENLLPVPTSLTASKGTSFSGVEVSWETLLGGVKEIYRTDSPVFENPELVHSAPIGGTTEITSVSPGKFYYFWARDRYGMNRSLPSNSVIGWRKLGTPQDLGVEAFVDHLKLTWIPVEGAVSYDVYRSLVDDPSSALRVGDHVEAADFEDYTAPAFAPVFYFVKANGEDFDGNMSASVSGHRLIPSPDDIQVESFIDRVTISWSPVTGAVDYLVYRSTSDRFSDAVSLGSTEEASFEDESAKVGEIYHYFVSSRNASQNSDAPSSSDPAAVDSGPDRYADLPEAAPGETSSSEAAPEDLFRGSFTGLIRQPDDADAITGQFSARVLRNTVTFNLSHEGQRYRGRGEFDANGALVQTLEDSDGVTLELNLQLMESDASGGFRLEGEAKQNANVVGEIFAYTNRFHPLLNPAPFAGAYTFLIPSVENADDVPYPTGAGFGSLRFTRNGAFRLSGKLADCERISLGGIASDDGELAFFQPLYGGTSEGFLAANLALRNIANISDLDGQVRWRRPSNDAENGLYPEGFDLQIQIIGSAYQPPMPGERMINSLIDQDENAIWSLEGGALDSAPRNRLLNWDRRNRIQDSRPETARNLKVWAGISSGLVGGWYADAETGINRIRFEGVVFQKQGLVSGHFEGVGECGLFSILPAEEPNIEVTDGAGGEIPVDGDVDFGDIGIEGGTGSRLIWITNTGGGRLYLDGVPEISGNSASSFHLGMARSGSLAPGETTLLQIHFDPSEIGAHTARLLIRSNDRDSNPYVLNLVGTGETGGASDEETGSWESDIEVGDEIAPPPTSVMGSFDSESDSGRYEGVAILGERFVSISIRISPSGGFSGRVMIDRLKGIVRGIVEPDGQLAITSWNGSASRVYDLGSLVLAQGDSNVRYVEGELIEKISGGAAGSFRLAKSSWNRGNVIPVAGTYTGVIPAGLDRGAGYPEGDSIALVSMSPTGRARMVVMLADGQRTALAGLIGDDQRWSFARQWRLGELHGEVEFEELAGIADFYGSVDWTRPESAVPSDFRAGFEMRSLDLVGSRFESAQPGELLLGGFSDQEGNAEIEISGANIEGGFGVRNGSLTARNQLVLGSNEEGFKLLRGLINPRNGLVRGVLVAPGFPRVKVTGVVFQGQDLITGFCEQGSSVGYFGVRPAP